MSNMADDLEGWTTEQKLSVISTFIVLVIPTIGINSIQGPHPTVETAFLWPWMLLVRYRPKEAVFDTDMYNFVLPPISLLVFLPTVFILRYAYTQFTRSNPREKVALKICIAALSQIFLIWVIYQSQELRIAEDYNLYFIPQLLVLLLQGIFSVKWYQERVAKTMRTPASEYTDDEVSTI